MPLARRLLFASAALCAVALSSTPARADAMIPGETGAFEVDYLNFILDHHWSGLRPTELAAGSLPDATEANVPPSVNPYPGSPLSFPPTEGKGTNEVVLDVADKSNAAQRMEIEEGQGFLQDWYGQTATLELQPTAAEMIETLEAAAPGDPFDIAFLINFSLHHISAIARSLECVDRAGHQELIDYCQNIVTAQTMDVQRMRAELLNEYGIRFDTPIPGEEVPEPAALGLLGLGALGTAYLRRRRAAVIRQERRPV